MCSSDLPGGADLPVLFIHDQKCPPGSIVRDGADLYLGEGASIDDALEQLRASVFSATEDGRSPQPDREQETAPTPISRLFSPFKRASRNPLTARLLRALPIAAMIVIGGVAGVMTVKMFDTRSLPLAHPLEAIAATPPTVV